MSKIWTYKSFQSGGYNHLVFFIDSIIFYPDPWKVLKLMASWKENSETTYKFISNFVASQVFFDMVLEVSFFYFTDSLFYTFPQRQGAI